MPHLQRKMAYSNNWCQDNDALWDVIEKKGPKPTMILKDEVQALRQVPLFAAMEPAKLKLLAFTSDRVSFAVD